MWLPPEIRRLGLPEGHSQLTFQTINNPRSVGGGLVTVGEALAEARYRAGLTVDEVSERTRIREAVIRCIEEDDYDACGGDLYVHGYVRAIAGAIGIDAQPLIREYDLGRTGAPGGADSAADPAAPGSAPAAADPAAPSIDPAETRVDLPVV